MVPWRRRGPDVLYNQPVASGSAELIRSLSETTKLLIDGASPEQALLPKPDGCKWVLEIYFPTVPEFKGKHDPKFCFNMCKGKKSHCSRPVCRLCKITIDSSYGCFDWDEAFRHFEQECTGFGGIGNTEEALFRAAIVKLDDPYMWVTTYMDDLKYPPRGCFFIPGRNCFEDKEFKIVEKWEKDKPSADPALVVAMKAATPNRCAGVDVDKIPKEMARIYNELVYKSDTSIPKSVQQKYMEKQREMKAKGEKSLPEPRFAKSPYDEDYGFSSEEEEEEEEDSEKEGAKAKSESSSNLSAESKSDSEQENGKGKDHIDAMSDLAMVDKAGDASLPKNLLPYANILSNVGINNEADLFKRLKGDKITNFVKLLAEQYPDELDGADKKGQLVKSLEEVYAAAETK